jgi:BirA family biotin operon repressor/biotin-[acetyl-CoA-carboxylase] ligase
MAYDGVSPEEMSRRLRAPSCLVVSSVTSVMDILHDLAAEGAPGGAVVLAEEQVRGRGRHGRRWHSPPGASICLGYLVRPGRTIEGGVLALRVGLALADTLRSLGAPAQLKWPNDVVVGDRKMSGVLCESRWRGGNVAWIAVGIGINVHGPLPCEVGDHAVSLDAVLPDATRILVLEQLLPALHDLSDEPMLSDRERSSYAQIDWLMGRRLREPVAGVAEGLAADGALLVKTPEGVRRVVGGGVVAA